MNLNDEKAYDRKIDEILARLEVLTLDVIDISLNRLLDAAFRHEASQLNHNDDL